MDQKQYNNKVLITSYQEQLDKEILRSRLIKNISKKQTADKSPATKFRKNF